MNRADVQQFYVQPEHVFDDHFILVKDELRHAIRALRKSAGDVIEAVDGQGNAYSGTIVSISKDEAKVSLANHSKNPGEPSIHLTLAQAVPKGSHFDIVIEKGTEIGISRFQPVITQRSIADPSSRIDRWRKKALAAMKQCGRSCCPEILPPVPFERYVEQVNSKVSFIAHEHFSASKVPESLSVKSCTLFIGPEGGFTEDEVNIALSNNVFPLQLGQRRLRSETAGIVGAVKLLLMFGEL